MSHIKKVACYRDNQKEFSSQKTYSSLLQRYLLFRKLKRQFLVQSFFLQHIDLELDENILNSQL
jgi:hypothetical protein